MGSELGVHPVGARPRCVSLEGWENMLSFHLLSGLRHHCWHYLDDGDERRKVTTGGEIIEHAGIRRLYSWEADTECCVCHRLANFWHDVQDHATALDILFGFNPRGRNLSIAYMKAHEEADIRQLKHLKSEGVPIKEPAGASQPKSG